MRPQVAGACPRLAASRYARQSDLLEAKKALAAVGRQKVPMTSRLRRKKRSDGSWQDDPRTC